MPRFGRVCPCCVRNLTYICSAQDSVDSYYEKLVETVKVKNEALAQLKNNIAELVSLKSESEWQGAPSFPPSDLVIHDIESVESLIESHKELVESLQASLDKTCAVLLDFKAL